MHIILLNIFLSHLHIIIKYIILHALNGMLRALFAKISNDIIRKILDYNTASLPVFFFKYHNSMELKYMHT